MRDLEKILFLRVFNVESSLGLGLGLESSACITLGLGLANRSALRKPDGIRVFLSVSSCEAYIKLITLIYAPF